MKRLTLSHPRDYVLIDESRIRWELLNGLSILAQHPHFPVELRDDIKALHANATEKVPVNFINAEIERLHQKARDVVWRTMHTKDSGTVHIMASAVMMILGSLTDCLQTKQSRKWIPWNEEETK